MKICFVTGTRAEYGLLYWLMRDIQKDPFFECQLIVTGMHLSPEFGLTYKEIEKDFKIDKKVEMLLSSDTPVGISKSMGLAQISFAEAYYWYIIHYDQIDIELRKIPIAYIANKKDWDFYSFFECTCMNKGIPVKAFQEENAVLKWFESL